MKKSLLLVAPLVFLLGGPHPSDAHGRQCRTISTRASFQILPPEVCTESPVALCAEATIHGSILRGSYSYSVDELALGGGLTSLPPSTLAVTGEFVWQTKAGTLIGIKTAMFDVVAGEQITVYNLRSGPYTGTLFASGFFDPETSFGNKRQNRLWGRVCRAE